MRAEFIPRSPEEATAAGGQAAAPAPVRDRQRRLLRGYLHKTSNSLCGIKGYAGLIAAGCDPDIPSRRWAQRILAEVEQMERVYASVQEMAFPAQRPRGDGNLTAAVNEAARQARRRHRQLRVSLAPLTPGALLLPTLDLELALAELLANSAESLAVDAVAECVHVEMGCVRCGHGRIALLVRDDGCGLSADLLAQAAHPFVTTKPGHLGIGLARVDTIMDMNGLAWSIQSREGRGTSVILEVAATGPLAGGHAASTEEG